MSDNHSPSIWQRRATRRRFVRGLSGAAAATGIVSLAGCAQPNTPAPTTAPAAPAPTTAASGAAAPAGVATSAPAARQPKRGGVFRQAVPTDTANMDVHQNVTAQL